MPPHYDSIDGPVVTAAPVIGVAEREIRERFAEMLRRQARLDGDVDATRNVEAMLGLQVWAHSLYESIHGDPHDHDLAG